jgi:hypothetical protein
LVDDRGRLFGRVNLVDASVAVFVVVLLPIAYGTWLLFHPRKVEVTSVTRVALTKDEQRIANPLRAAAKLKVKGRQFSPMLRAWIGSEPALGFMFEDPNSADVIAPPMPPGAYDLILYDGGQEVARVPRAYVVAAPENRGRVTAVGRFVGLDRSRAEQLKVGTPFPPAGEASARVTALGAVEGSGGTVERAASVLVECDATPQPGGCGLAGIPVAPASAIRLPGATDPMTFVVDELLPGTPPQPLEIAVQFGGGPETALITAGDRDQLVDDRAAVVRSVGPRQPGRALDVRLRLGADQGRDGWQYRGRMLKVGAPFALTTTRYVANGIVASVTEAKRSDER